MDTNFDTRRAALTLSTFQGKERAHVDPGNSVRVYNNSPGTAVIQLRHDNERRITIASASLDINELKALRGMIDAAIRDVRE